MAVNTSPIFTLTPNVGFARITTASANTKSDGAGTVGTDIFKAFTAGANGSFLDRVRFNVTASAAATNSVATTLRIFLSTVGSGNTTNADTWLLGEVSVPLIAADHSTQAVNFYEFPIGIAIPAGMFVHVSQHNAQTTNQSWIAIVTGGDY